MEKVDRVMDLYMEYSDRCVTETERCVERDKKRERANQSYT